MTTWLIVVLATARRVRLVPLALRGGIAAMAAVAIAATTVPAWDAPNGYVIVAVLAAVAFVLVPDSGSGLLFVGALIVTWVTRAPGGVGPAVVVTALALLAGHVAAALATAMPITARTDRAVVLRWARPTAVIAAAVLAGAALVAVLDAGTAPGSVLVTVAALVVATAGAWWWSAPD